MQTLRRTPLHVRHAEAGARLVPFAGWELMGAPAATVVAGTVVWQRVEL